MLQERFVDTEKNTYVCKRERGGGGDRNVE